MNRFYPIKHWLATLAIAPLLLSLSDRMKPHNSGDISFGELYPIFIAYGLLFALPALLLYYIAFYFVMNNCNFSSILIKIILDTIAILSLIITGLFFGTELTSEFFIGYSIAIILTSLFFKIRNKSLDTEPVNNNDND